MTTPSLYNPREATQIHLEIVDDIIEVIQDTFPAAATLDCHRQMRDILIRVKNTLDHPILFAAHIIVYLVKAVRFSRRWATLVKNIAALDPNLFKTHSSVSSLKSQASSLPSTSSVLSTQTSLLNPQSTICNPQSPILTPQHSALRTQHSLQTRLRIRAFAQALQHERHIAEKLPPSVLKPDLTPILPVHRHSPLSSQSSVLSTQSSLFSPHSSALSTQRSALSSQLPLFPSEAFWESKVRSLQLKILGNITRIFPALGRAYLRHYNASISSTSSTPSTPSTPSFQSHSSHSSHPSHSSHLSYSSSRSPSPPSPSSPPSPLTTQPSPLSSHPPPPQEPSQT